VKVLTARRAAGVLALLSLAVAGAVIVGLAAGSSSLSAREVVSVLLAPEREGAAADIVLRVRLPRVVLSLLVGASLSVAGVLFQALLRNARRSVRAGRLRAAPRWAGSPCSRWAPPSAYRKPRWCRSLHRRARDDLLLGLVSGSRASPTSLLLTGVVFNAFASAGIVFLASLAGLSEGASVFLWLIGSLSSVRADVAGWVALFLFAGLACALPLARSLNLLTLGEEAAQQLGVDVARVQRVLLVAASLMVGAAVSVAGLVGFVGLIIPHLLRLLIGPDHRSWCLRPRSPGRFLLCATPPRAACSGRELRWALTSLAGGRFFGCCAAQQRIFARERRAPVLLPGVSAGWSRGSCAA
jgi:iron complex transport system permease protein